MENDSKEIDTYKNPEPPEPPKDNTMVVAVVSLIFGILSCIGNVAWGFGSMACVILGIVGIFMSINANKKRSTVPGTLGLISSIVGTIISGAGTACVICASTCATATISAIACGLCGLR